MNKNEKEYLHILYSQVNMKGNFDSIKDKIQIQKGSKPIKSLNPLIFKILMPCEFIAAGICLGLFLVRYIISRLGPFPEGGQRKNIEIIYLILSIVFAFIFLMTLAFYKGMKSKKGGKIK